MASFLDPLLSWMLYMHPALAIVLVSLLISLLVTLAMKFLTDQSLMKDLRDELKELQKEMRSLKNNPEKMAKVNSQVMETNMKYMTQSMRPTLFTFIPLIIIFGWLGSHLAYYPLLPDKPFTLTAQFKDTGSIATLAAEDGLEIIGPASKEVVTEEVDWQLKGPVGEYEVQIDYMGEIYDKDLLITEERAYAQVEKTFKNKPLKKVILGNRKILPFEDVPVFQDIPWVNTWGWLGVYLVCSIGFSMLLRRLFKIY